MRIGIPRALLYYDDYPFWRHLLAALGQEVVLSPPTNKDIVDEGVRLALDEACLPVKVCYGHLAALRESGVEAILLPRYVSLEKQTYLCPKLLGLPEMVAGIPGLPRLLKPSLDLTRKDFDALARELAHELGVKGSEARQAVEAARVYQEEVWGFLRAQRVTPELAFGSAQETAGIWEAVSSREWEKPEETLRLGLLGHPYNLYDTYTNMDVLKTLRAWGVEVITPELVEPAAVAAAARTLPKRLFWSLGERIVGAGLTLLQSQGVAGIIHLAAFGCGLDSMVGEILARRARREGEIPFMTINLDEHTGQAGFLTRLEAFVDMLRRRLRLRSEAVANLAPTAPGTPTAVGGEG